MQEGFEGAGADVVALQGNDVGAPVSVATPGVGVEEPVVGQERWEEMHRLKAIGMTVSGIARVTGLDRKTVRRCLRQVRWQVSLTGIKEPGMIGVMEPVLGE